MGGMLDSWADVQTFLLLGVGVYFNACNCKYITDY